jgi:hypothetical protein
MERDVEEEASTIRTISEADDEERAEREQTSNVDDVDIDESGVALDVSNGEDG